MTISASDELIASLAELHELFPEWRVGQLVANLVTAAGGTDESAIWDIEDEQLLTAAHRLIDHNRGRKPVSVVPDTLADRGGLK
jgi:hypothetical protein